MLHVAVNVADALCPPEAPTAAVADLDWRLAHLAGEALLEIGLKEVESSSRYVSILDRVRSWLVALIQKGALAPKERALAGATLGKLGDPREGVRLRDGLLDVTDFIPLPGGKFKLGETGQAVEVSPFRLGRYPVTVAQYQAFVDQGGYGAPDGPRPSWWTCAVRLAALTISCLASSASVFVVCWGWAVREQPGGLPAGSRCVIPGGSRELPPDRRSNGGHPGGCARIISANRSP